MNEYLFAPFGFIKKHMMPILNRFTKNRYKPSIFKSTVLQEEFNKQGYVIIDFLTVDQVNQLLDNYTNSYHNIIDREGFHASSFSMDKNYVEKISNSIVSIMQPALEAYFKDYSVFLASYLVKEPYSNSTVWPHQDWNIVDEEKYYAINAWTALSDFNFTNGTLAIIPASQNIYQTYRGTGDPYISTDLDKYREEIYKKSIFLNLKAGQSVVYNVALLHASSSNQSDYLRIASGVGLIPKSARLIHCIQNKANETIDVFEIDSQFLVEYPISLKNLKEVKAYKIVKNPVITRKDLIKKKTDLITFKLNELKV